MIRRRSVLLFNILEPSTTYINMSSHRKRSASDSNDKDNGIKKEPLNEEVPEQETAPDAPPNAKRPRLRFTLEIPSRSETVGEVFVNGDSGMRNQTLNADFDYGGLKKAIMIGSAVDVRAGREHSLVLTTEGEVFSFGCNSHGALGRPDTPNEDKPVAVALPAKAVKISAGHTHSACLLEDGSVFAWGTFHGSYGFTGFGMQENTREPLNIMPNHKCVDIACGANHLVMLTNTGKVFTVGNGEHGQLGRIALRSADGDSRRGMASIVNPFEVYCKSKKPISQIWALQYATILKEHNTDKIYAFGRNDYNQLPILSNDPMISFPMLTTLSDVKKIVGAINQTLVLKNNGDVFAMGLMDHGLLGIGPGDKRTQVSQLTLIEDLTGKNIVDIGCGHSYSYAISANGELYAWGSDWDLHLLYPNHSDLWSPRWLGKLGNLKILQAEIGSYHGIYLAVEDGERIPLKTFTCPMKGDIYIIA